MAPRGAAGRAREAGALTQTYRALGHTFRIEAQRGELAEPVRRALAAFAVPDLAEDAAGVACYQLDQRPGSDSLRLRYDGHDLIRSGVPEWVFAYLLWHVNAEAARRTEGLLLIHAGAVASPGSRGVLIPAPSGSGKTTLVAGLVRAGFGYLSDEAAALDPGTRQVLPHPKALAFKRDPVELLGVGGVAPMARQWHLLADQLRPGAVAAACPVGAVVALRYRVGAATRLEPLSRGAAVVELGRNALNLPAFGARALPLLGEVVAGATCWRLETGDLAEAVTAVAQLCAVAAFGGEQT